MLNAGAASDEPPMRTNYREWFQRVVLWDGLIAGSLMMMPLILQQLWQKDGQNDEKQLTLFAIFIPIGAFLLRWFIGARHLDRNRCSLSFRQFQFLCFGGGLFAMLLGDCMVLCLHDMMPQGQILIQLIMLAPFYATYLLCMIVAMYPGQEPIPDNERERIGNWDVVHK